MKKIGIYDPYLDTLGGGERYMLTLAECLSENFKVEVFWDNKSIHSKAENKFNINLKKVFFVKNIFSNNSSKLIRYLKSTKYHSIVVLSDGSIPLLAGKSIIHFQAPLNDEISQSQKKKLSTVKKIIVNSEYTKKNIDKVLGVKSKVIYPPVEINNFSPHKRKENIILSVGRYSKLPSGDFKKHDILIQQFKKIHDNGLKNWRLVIVMSYLEKDRKNVKNLVIKTRNYPIEILTRINAKEITNLYEKSKIYWHAAGFNEDLEKYPDRAEHFGISIVEAMASGTVPIAFNAGGIKETIEDNFSGKLWNNLEELTNFTLELINQSSKLNKLKKNGIDRSKKFSRENFCNQVRMHIQ